MRIGTRLIIRPACTVSLTRRTDSVIFVRLRNIFRIPPICPHLVCVLLIHIVFLRFIIYPRGRLREYIRNSEHIQVPGIRIHESHSNFRGSRGDSDNTFSCLVQTDNVRILYLYLIFLTGKELRKTGNRVLIAWTEYYFSVSMRIMRRIENHKQYDNQTRSKCTCPFVVKSLHFSSLCKKASSRYISIILSSDDIPGIAIAFSKNLSALPSSPIIRHKVTSSEYTQKSFSRLPSFFR